MRWLYFSKVLHTDTCGAFPLGPTRLHAAESDRFNMASVMEFGESTGACRDAPGLLKRHSAFL